MATNDHSKKTLEQARKLLGVLTDLHRKQAATIAELETILGGGPSIGDTLKRLYRSFESVWAERYRVAYVWTYQKDAPNMKRLALSLGAEEVEARMTRFIADSDPFLTRARHGFGLFVAGINKYTAPGADLVDFELEEGPLDCRHTPRCQSDQEHTRRRRDDLHA